MVKPATTWLRGLLRAGKAQQRTARKLAKVLFAPVPAQSKPKRKPASATSTLKPHSKSPPRARKKAAPAPGKWLASHYVPLPELGTLPGRRLPYFLYIPQREPSAAMLARGRPLLVMLHGCEQSATQFAEGTRMNRLAERKGYAVLYPQQSLRAQARRCWKWYDKLTQEGGGDVRLIIGAIEQVAARYAIDRTRIYICGISAGAGMAHIVALNHPQLFAALGLHSGPVFGGGHNLIGALNVMQHGAATRVDTAIDEVLLRQPDFPRLPMLLLQGQADQVVRPVNQDQLVRQSLRLNRMPADTVVTAYRVPASVAGSRTPAHAYAVHDYQVGKALLLRVAQIEHLGHAWSGGDPSLPFNDKARPDASKLLLDFFAGQRRL
ncbi:MULTISPECIES: PHB depolymerase family esterase [unclassified Janthinobacterium]|uniref:extracellular catalytic domain type 1 short-chain-length polyhydroxyalkanoate depolymerase n=1 Tax=unclassified Janthinobacterium TaxID=2610881 RepID=UPI00161A8A16|nr:MULTISPECIES: PHB depolymerase family esterase [unclassified Janthinobacterium]MBB5367419.1 poly(hydroxyalkanoate) depolymerase family esterase [Janthinobacterium sp. K2C7]MBB5380103.1 poly(hydroxyalkanoate) depolymerase family esterase [Janthinobacterium sp. K2Li3]MBB5385801.1 poly(hydroxyalkanoate) depolymerase family esterase [Janthinobacterium sp. K2E3]